MDKKVIVNRLGKEQDVSQINELYRTVFNETRERSEYEWEFRNNPFGTSPVWVSEDKQLDKIIAHRTLIPYQLRDSSNNELFLTGKIENTMLHPEYRGKGIYSQLEIEAENFYFANGFKIIWSSANLTKTRRKRHAFKEIITCDNIILVNRKMLFPKYWPKIGYNVEDTFWGRKVLSSKLNDKVHNVANAIGLNFYLANSPPSWDISILHESDIIIDNYKLFANWRFANNPFLKHYFLCVKRFQEPIALFVLTPTLIRIGRLKVNTLNISDLHYRYPYNADELKVIFRAINNYANSAFIILWYNPLNPYMTELVNILRKLFLFTFSSKQKIPFMAKAEDISLLDDFAKRLWFTNAFNEGKWA